MPPPPPPPPASTTPAASTSQKTKTSDEAAPSRYRITGRVINAITKDAIGKAEITVSPMGVRRANARLAGRAGGRTVTAIADVSGRFEVEVPSAGGWSITAAAYGYHTQAFEEHDGYSTAIILTEANPAFSVTFPLTPAASIEGYVLDEAGEAVRNAQLSLSLIPPATPEDQHPRRQSRGSQRTDDRGFYKFSGLLSGNYGIRVQAQPWYASSASNNNRSGIGAIAGGVSVNGVAFGGLGSADGEQSPAGADASAPDPLDVVYPTIWYPGVSDFAAATPITVRGGETHQADFHLLPIPGFHLRIAAEPPVTDGDGQPNVNRGGGIRNGGYLSQLLPDGTEAAMPTTLHPDSQGNLEYSGLAPGTYVVHRQGEFTNAYAAPDVVRISANSAAIVDLTQASPATVVTVKIDAEADKPSLQISFRDTDSGRVSYAQGLQNFGTGGPHRGAPVAIGTVASASPAPLVKETSSVPDRTVSLQPGRYEVVLNGGNDLHLTSIEATGATATGRMVSIGGGSPTLTLHVASGRVNVTGFIQSKSKPIEGAMVLLVPASLGDPAGLDITRRDQSNTDGSFDITGVLPGTYILVAIDHGWDVNWSDPATLRRLLIQGLPLDLTAPGDRKETVEAQSP